LKYCAFLRGVNVNGTSMKMAEVSKVFTDAGMNNVSTVLATGNILFSSDLKSSELKVILEQSMSKYFSYEAFLFIKTEKEIFEIFEKNPFEKSTENHIYVFVGRENIENILLEEFKKSDFSENEKGKIVAGIFYWQIQKGQTLDSTFGKILGKKVLKDQLTSRNMNTIEKIIVKFNKM
jgi:uncharacterized protein (DUF1697 family)